MYEKLVCYKKVYHSTRRVGHFDKKAKQSYKKFTSMRWIYLYIKWFKKLGSMHNIWYAKRGSLAFTITIVLIFMMMKFSEYSLYSINMTVLLSTTSVRAHAKGNTVFPRKNTYPFLSSELSWNFHRVREVWYIYASSWLISRG